MSEEKAKILKIDDVLKLNLSIPDYQRPYKWTIKHVQQLLDDLLTHFRNQQQVYRIGTVVIHKYNEENKETQKIEEKLDIVDGQQRLITLSLLLHSLGSENNLLNQPLTHSISKNNVINNYDFIKNYSISDTKAFKKYLLETIALLPNVRIEYSCSPICIKQKGELWEIETEKYMLQTAFLLNASYAGVNEILKITEGGVFSSFKIKYEKCEIILCEVNEKLKKTGITVMDGPFFSIMPFGKTGLHSLTSVAFTPHETSYEQVAEFPCQKEKKVDNSHCIPGSLENCNVCQLKPDSAWAYMSSLTRKYLKEELNFTYHSSLYSIKPILMNSEVDDSRPTLIRKHCSKPTLISVLSGKINTVYDLDEVLVDD
mgnify:CR=1 FL=1